MSDYEHHRGTLYPVREDLTPTEFAEFLFDDLPKNYTTKLELLLEAEEYYCTKDQVYQVRDTKHTDSDWYTAKLCDDGVIEYDVVFYNGGCGFFEALDDAISEAKK